MVLLPAVATTWRPVDAANLNSGRPDIFLSQLGNKVSERAAHFSVHVRGKILVAEHSRQVDTPATSDQPQILLISYQHHMRLAALRDDYRLAESCTQGGTGVSGEYVRRKGGDHFRNSF